VNAIVHYLLEQDDDLDNDFVKDMSQSPSRAGETVDQDMDLAIKKGEYAARQKIYRDYLSNLKAQVLAGNFSGVTPELVKKEPTILPDRFWKARSRLNGLAKRYARASHVSSVKIESGNRPPRVTSGGSGGWFTKGGTPISHPSAYSKIGWSNMEYRTNDEVVSVGFDWLAKKLPIAAEFYSRYALLLDPSLKPALEPWLASRRQNYGWAYDSDDPLLTESSKQ
jgi:hypothetical protein